MTRFTLLLHYTFLQYQASYQIEFKWEFCYQAKLTTNGRNQLHGLDLQCCIGFQTLLAEHTTCRFRDMYDFEVEHVSNMADKLHLCR